MADISTPFPDRGKEALRIALVQAQADVEWNAGSSDMSFDLVDSLFVLLGGALAQIDALAARLDLMDPDTATAAGEPPACPTSEA